MDIGEMIHIYEHCKLVSDCFDTDAVTAAYVEGLSALRAQQDMEKNECLSLEELRNMDGEPVWIDDWYEDTHGWELSMDAEDYVRERDIFQYGSQWRAYRYEPKEKEDLT